MAEWVNIADVPGITWEGQADPPGIWSLEDGIFSIEDGRRFIHLGIYLPVGNPYSDYRVTFLSFEEHVSAGGSTTLNSRWYPFNGDDQYNDFAAPTSEFSPNGAVLSVPNELSEGVVVQSSWPASGSSMFASIAVRIEVREGGAPPADQFWTDIVGAFES